MPHNIRRRASFAVVFMNCKNHPDRPATGRCSECGENFCEDCLSKFNQTDYCAACLKAEAAIVAARMVGGGKELSRMKRALVGCSVVLLGLVLIPMVLLVYPMFRLGDIGGCRANLKKLYQEALLVYAEENNGQFPPDNNNLKPLFDRGLVTNAEWFRCPGAIGLVQEGGGPRETSSSGFPPNSSYLYQGGLPLPGKGEPSQPLAWDRSPQHHRGKGINVLRTDGSIQFETKELSRFRLRKPSSRE